MAHLPYTAQASDDGKRWTTVAHTIDEGAAHALLPRYYAGTPQMHFRIRLAGQTIMAWHPRPVAK